jgi:ParB family chromosome partitioning protein
MRRMSEDGKLTKEAIEAIMSEKKPNQKEKIVLSGERFKDLFPKNLPLTKREDYVAAAMEYYGKYLERMRNVPER